MAEGGGKEALGTEGQGEVKGRGVWEPGLVVKYCGRCLGRAVGVRAFKLFFSWVGGV